MNMSGPVKLIECPRDAWQGLKGQIPPDIKRAYLQALVANGQEDEAIHLLEEVPGCRFKLFQDGAGFIKLGAGRQIL